MTVRQHLEAAYKQSGVMPAQLADAPPLPDECRSIWDAFIELRTSCPSNGLGPGRISFTEIDAYQRTTGDRLGAWGIKALRKVDAAWLEVKNSGD